MAEEGFTCAMTGLPVSGPIDAIWDDGEWVSWDWINSQIDGVDAPSGFLIEDDPEDEQPHDWDLCCMIWQAFASERRTGETSKLWGRIGELYASERFGIALSRDGTQGHDGKLGDEFVEIKTISPHKRCPFVRVKRAGNFSMLAVVRIRSDEQFEARLVKRSALAKGNGGRYLVLTWSQICNMAEPI